MRIIAIAFLACQAFGLLPGSSVKGGMNWRDLDWQHPHVYTNIGGSLLAIALAIMVVA